MPPLLRQENSQDEGSMYLIFIKIYTVSQKIQKPIHYRNLPRQTHFSPISLLLEDA